MFVDRFDAIEEYYPYIPHLKTAVELIRSRNDWTAGRYEFEGGYLLYQEQSTKPMSDGTYENHRFYADLQYLVAGEGWSTLWNRVEQMQSAVPYDAVKDAERWTGEGTVVNLKPGMFVGFLPSDAHKPDRHPDGTEGIVYKKFVIKLKLAD